MRKKTERDKSRDSFLDRQLRKQAHAMALAKCKEKGIKKNAYNDPYDIYYSYLTTFEVQFYNELRIEKGLATSKTPKPKSMIERIFKPAKQVYREEWQDQAYG